MAAHLRLGLDIGTTTISAVVADISTKTVLASRTQKHNADIPASTPEEKIQSPETIDAIARSLLAELLDRFPEIAAIGITGQMHGILYLDQQGNPISPLYTWQDQRSAGLCARLREQTGYPLAPGYGLATHCALSETGMVPQNAWKLGTIMDYIVYSLCGKQQFLMHATNAASLGFFRLETGEFDRNALRKAGIDPELLPPVTWDTAFPGCYKGIPVSVAIGDNQASFLGSVPDPENMVLANFGTGSQISRTVSAIPPIPADSSLEVRPFLRNTYLLCGSALCGGRPYALWEQFLRSFAVRCGMPEESRYDVLNALAEAGLSRKDLPDVRPTFCGTRTDPALRGTITNIGEDTFTPEAFTAGLLLGMARELYDLFCIMPHGQVSQVVASGNGIRKNPALQKALGQIFALPVMVSSCQEEAAFGAALFAGLAGSPPL